MDNMSKLLDQLGPDIRRPTKDQVNDMVRRRTKAGAITEGIPLSKKKKKIKQLNEDLISKYGKGVRSVHQGKKQAAESFRKTARENKRKN